MNRLGFIKSLSALFVIPFAKKGITKTEIESLNEDYYKAANALNNYKTREGFLPGVRVEAQFMDECPILGTIAPYGSQWGTVSHTGVPVILDKGYCQEWQMRNLKIV